MTLLIIAVLLFSFGNGFAFRQGSFFGSQMMCVIINWLKIFCLEILIKDFL